jgi:hypothetical protein
MKPRKLASSTKVSPVRVVCRSCGRHVRTKWEREPERSTEYTLCESCIRRHARGGMWT